MTTNDGDPKNNAEAEKDAVETNDADAAGARLTRSEALRPKTPLGPNTELGENAGDGSKSADTDNDDVTASGSVRTGSDDAGAGTLSRRKEASRTAVGVNSSVGAKAGVHKPSTLSWNGVRSTGTESPKIGVPS
jgi:hypothetical protein